uniref:Uncharacterized protein n=1 Tax=Kwoniella dejecticola CBS 10117 TaxID=1296121 RepID=A0A1A6AFK7_9TREE|nr:uncharacterized protein I303_00651 [Kwoniella dejecticola CBS 10117]OBR88834.1 hypothetical protein I303_00651 [Kwoniella dejecticola CBS 10117]
MGGCGTQDKELEQHRDMEEWMQKRVWVNRDEIRDRWLFALEAQSRDAVILIHIREQFLLKLPQPGHVVADRDPRSLYLVPPDQPSGFYSEASPYEGSGREGPPAILSIKYASKTKLDHGTH